LVPRSTDLRSRPLEKTDARDERVAG
jgi:hypothetical protein